MTPCWVLRKETEEKLIVDEDSGDLYIIYRSTDDSGKSHLILSNYTPADSKIGRYNLSATTASLEGR